MDMVMKHQVLVLNQVVIVMMRMIRYIQMQKNSVMD